MFEKVNESPWPQSNMFTSWNTQKSTSSQKSRAKQSWFILLIYHSLLLQTHSCEVYEHIRGLKMNYYANRMQCFLPFYVVYSGVYVTVPYPLWERESTLSCVSITLDNHQPKKTVHHSWDSRKTVSCLDWSKERVNTSTEPYKAVMVKKEVLLI